MSPSISSMQVTKSNTPKILSSGIEIGCDTVVVITGSVVSVIKSIKESNVNPEVVFSAF